MDDPNGWLGQICHTLRLVPGERLREWTAFSRGVLRINAVRWELPHAEFSPEKVVQVLDEARVSFVLVGMGAGYLQGAPLASYNTDIMPYPDPDNLERAEIAWRRLGSSELRVKRCPPVERPVLPGIRQLMTSVGMVNVVEYLPGVGDYQTVKRRSSLMDLGEGLSVRVADMEHVIRSKEALGRRNDAVHVLMCREVLEVKRRYGKAWSLF